MHEFSVVDRPIRSLTELRTFLGPLRFVCTPLDLFWRLTVRTVAVSQTSSWQNFISVIGAIHHDGALKTMHIFHEHRIGSLQESSTQCASEKVERSGQLRTTPKELIHERSKYRDSEMFRTGDARGFHQQKCREGKGRS